MHWTPPRKCWNGAGAGKKWGYRDRLDRSWRVSGWKAGREAIKRVVGAFGMFRGEEEGFFETLAELSEFLERIGGVAVKEIAKGVIVTNG